ncbi:MAG: DUF4242 domain-containing protein [Phycisphaerales bacterium]|nr:DUF4242 domain-containing protein [Phycisphaerales bacterium]
MPRYVIERNVPGAGELNSEQLQAISRRSCDVLRGLGPEVQWVQSYVSRDRIYCVYIAPDETLIREHAARCDIPADRISRITSIIDPTTAE